MTSLKTYYTHITILVFMVCMYGTSANAQVHIYFRFNISEIDKNQEAALLKLVETVKQSKIQNYQIKISGYCDVKGTDAYNDQLSQKRAAAVKGFLVSKGIKPDHIISVKAWGKRKPINKNTTDEERQANRRVDVQYEIIKAPAKVTSQNFSRNIDTAKEGTHIVLPNLNFYGGMHRLLPESRPILDTLLKVLKKNPKLNIRIEGHVCCTDNGADGEDMETHTWGLSVARAKVVYGWLLDHGIAQSRLSYKGMAGKYHLVDPESTEEDKTQNRRVEMVVLSK